MPNHKRYMRVKLIRPMSWSMGERLKLLERRLGVQLRDVQRLQEERERLELRHAVLAALNEALAVIHGWVEEEGDEPVASAGATHSSDGDGSSNTAASAASWVPGEREAQLLHELEQLPLPPPARGGSSVGYDEHDSGGGGDDDEPRPIAPLGDPLLLMRELRVRANRVTVEQFREQHGALVREMALQLQLLKAGGGWQSGPGSFAGSNSSGSGAALARVHERLQAAVLADTRLFVSIAGFNAGKGTIMTDVQLTNAVTGERLQEPDVEMHRRMLARLRLSRRQLQRVRTGAEVLLELHGRLLEQLHAAQAECVAVTACSAAAVAADGTNAAAGEHLGQLQRQEEHSARLQRTLQCELTFRTAAVLYFVGCLSHPQLAQLLVEAWPYTPAWFLLIKQSMFL